MLSSATASPATNPASTTEQTQLCQSALKKNAWRMMPLLIAALIFSYIDKNNAGFAALTMNQALHLSTAQFGWGAGLLFVGYCLFEVPSNLALYRYGARRWLARIMVTWGIATGATAFISGAHGFYAMRFLLGVAEAGFFPGVTYLLACWFPAEYRARMLALFTLGAPLSSVISGPMSGLLFKLDGTAWLQGWQWMFIAQGLPAMLVGIGIYYCLRDRPDDAQWLTGAEKTALTDLLKTEASDKHKVSSFAALKDKRIYLLGAIQFGFVVSTYGVGIWLPLILRQYGYSFLTIGFLSSIPYIFAAVFTYLWAQRVDKTGNRTLHLMLACLLGALGLALSTLSLGIVVKLIGISLAALAVFAARAIFWSIPTSFLTGRAAAGGLALINTIGTLGGFVGTMMVGQLKQIYGTFAAGIWAMAALFLVSAALTASMWLFGKQA